MNWLINTFWLHAARCERSRQRADSHATRTGTCFSTGGAIAHDAAPVAQELAGSAALLFHGLQEGSSSFARRRVCSRGL